MLNLNASKYTINMIHTNGLLHKIVDVPSYDDAQMWAWRVQRATTPLMMVIVDDEGNTEEIITAKKDEQTSGKTLYQDHKTGRKWWGY